jgi:peroxiredoxin
MILLVAALLAAAPASTVRMHESGSAKVGSAAPSFAGWDLTGQRALTLDGLRRTPYLLPLLITFGASSCKPCAESLPRLKAFTKRHPEVRLVFVAVEDVGDKAQQLVTKTGIADAPALLDKQEQAAKAYGVAGEQKAQLPRTFLVDAGGKVRAIYGVEGEDFERTLEADVETVAPAPRPASEGK